MGFTGRYTHITHIGTETPSRAVLTVIFWQKAGREALKFGYCCWKKPSAITGRTCCSFSGSLALAAAFGRGFQTVEEDERASKSAAT